MVNLINAEFFILSKSVGFKVLMFVSLLFGGMAVTLDFFRIGLFNSNAIGFDEIIACQQMTLYNMIFGCIFAAIFICSGFKRMTYGISLLSGNSRIKIFFAKFIVSLTGMFLLSLMFITVPVIIAIFNGTIIKSDGNGAGYILSRLLFALIGFMAQAAVIILLAVSTKNGTATVATGIVFTYLLLIIKANLRFYENPAIEPYLKYIYLYQAELFRLKEQGFSDVMYMAVIILTLIASIIFSALLFEKAELK
ncbi:MAG: hypothetical protein HFH68_11525 [Lachnospiraceae bacterium]|nr:hypothetical protein [Lachnospiraceae bacterium]